jgi:ferrous iron transport protein A
MFLGDVHVGHSVTVVSIGGERSFRRRLMELGVLPGTRIEVVRIAPLGDPVELLARGCRLSIRKNEAALIEVTEAKSSTAARATSAASVPEGLPASP